LAVPARLELATFGLGNRCSMRPFYFTVTEPERFRLMTLVCRVSREIYYASLARCDQGYVQAAASLCGAQVNIVPQTTCLFVAAHDRGAGDTPARPPRPRCIGRSIGRTFHNRAR